MLLTETIKYRNREIPVTELKPNSDKQVWVLCPDCKKVRQVYWKVFLKAKSHKCHSCTNMAHSKDIEPGTKYGKLIVIDKRKSGYSVCQCDCGEITEIANYNLRTNHTKSCGCLKLDSFRNAKPCIGKKHGNWKGGITPENVSIRKSVQYKVWREMVFARDNYTCQDCGQVGYELRAHHVYNFANNKDKRLDVNNGITLCDKCHRKFHRKYGNNSDVLIDQLNRYREEIPFITTIKKINRYYTLS